VIDESKYARTRKLLWRSDNGASTDSERCRDSFSVSGRAGHARWQEGDLWAREMTVGILSRVRNDDLRPGNVGSVVGRLAG
jgi:hypothetical protein